MVSRLRLFLAKHWRNTVYSNVWIALGAGAFVLQGELLLKSSSDYILPIFVFFATVFLYNFQRAVKLFHKPSYSIPGRNTWLVKNRTGIVIWCIIGGIAMLAIALSFPLRDWIVLSVGGFISVAYVLKIGRRDGKGIAVRELPFVKIFLIAISWVITGVVLPFVHHFDHVPFENLTSSNLGLMALEKFLFILAITIPFDIRDLEFDDDRMRTIPKLIGVKRSVWLAQILTAISGLICLYFGYAEVYPTEVVAALVGVYFFIASTLSFARVKRDELYYTGWLDGTIILQSAAVWWVVNYC